ncbi:hypothetical protein ACPCSE_30030 [Streptomyces cellulosae]
MSERQHTPTRLCPHRWCRPVHTLLTVVAVALLAPLVFHSIVVALALPALGLISYAILRAVRGRTLTELAAEDVATRHSTSSAPHLVYRPGWARIAIAGDLFFLLLAATALPAVLLDSPGEAERVALEVGDISSLVTAVAFAVFTQYAHRKATEPVKPKRATVPQAI